MANPNANKQIRDMLEKYGEEFNDGTVWRVQGNPVIGHKTLERIAARAGIWFDAPTIVRAQRDEAVILVMGHMGDDSAAGIRDEWSIGEALIDVNYRVSGRQAAYVWAMAEKRAKDRVILKLVNLHGLLYSEEEADEFKQGRPQVQVPAIDPMERGTISEDEAGFIGSTYDFPGDMPALNPRPKSSAALKREDAWGRAMEDLKSDLTDCFTVVSLTRLREIYRERARKEGWNRAFLTELKEVFDKAEEDLERQDEAA